MATANDVMTRDVTTIGTDATVDEFIKIIEETSFSGLPVVEDGRAVGLISQNDVLRALAFACTHEVLPPTFQKGKRKASSLLLEVAEAHRRSVEVAALLKTPVKVLMTPDVVTCNTETPLKTVCELMVDARIHRVVVGNADGRVTGLISATDLVRYLGEHST
jgi:CBS domain-containing protein